MPGQRAACVRSHNAELWFCRIFCELQSTTALNHTVAQVRWRSQVAVLFALSPAVVLAFAQTCDSWIRNWFSLISFGQNWFSELALGE